MQNYKNKIRDCVVKIAGLFVAVLLLVSETTVQALTVNVSAGASTSTIQNAIDQVTAAGGGTVNLAAGAYTATAPLNIKSGVTLSGAGSPATTITANSAFNVIQQAAEGLSNVTIQNLKIYGILNTNCYGIIVSALSTYHTNVTISGVQVVHCGMGIHLKRVNGVTVANCNIHDNGAWQGTLGYDNLYLRNCNTCNINGTIINNCSTAEGFHIAGTCNSISITYCTLTGNQGDGLYMQDTPSNVSIGNCTSSNNTGDGLDMVGSNLTIYSNTCNNNTEWILATGQLYTPGYGIHTWSGTGTIHDNSCSGNAGANYLLNGSFTKYNNN